MLGIVLLEASAENSEATTQALGALAAMRPIGLDLVDARAAYGPRDQIGTAMRLNPFEDLALVRSAYGFSTVIASSNSEPRS